jgi:adenylylsulfate kinase
MNPQPSKAYVRQIALERIRTDGETQARCAIESSVVQQYAELMAEGVMFPPVRTWYDGGEYWLVDGFHRIMAARTVGATSIAAEVIHGSLAEAQWDSYSANAKHGLRRDAVDIEIVIRRALLHPLALKYSNSHIARHLGIPEATLRRWRKRLSSSTGEDASCIALRKGRPYVMKTARIGQGAGRNPACSPSTTALLTEIEHAKNAVGPDSRRLLNVMEKWIRRESSDYTFLPALAAFVQALGGRPRHIPFDGVTVWLTGLSWAGKSTIAKLVCEELRSMRLNVEWLDADAMRESISKGLGFSKSDRDENVRRIGWLAEMLTRNGVIVVVSAISPYREVRREIRERIGSFIEVFVNAPLSVCEDRDLKGVSHLARNGELSGVTGLDDPYESPENPELVCPTDRETPSQSAARVLRAILGRAKNKQKCEGARSRSEMLNQYAGMKEI